MIIKKTLNQYAQNLDNVKNHILDGEIYECFCLEYIINNSPEIKFVQMKEDKTNKNGFYISSGNNLVYQSNEIDLGEFDLLGFDKKNSLHWFEITKQKTNFKIVKDKILRKKELLDKLFDNYNFTIVVPENNVMLSELGRIMIINEPNYCNFRKPNYEFKFLSNNFVTLNFLREKTKEYSYINDLIEKSISFYKNKNRFFDSNLFERLYDIQNINHKEFEYYDVEKKRFDKIHEKHGEFFKNNKKIQHRKATYKEIIQIREKMKS